MRSVVQRRPNRRGFTLIEVLLAITITGFVLAGATTLIVSISNIWANRQNSHFFGDHVDGVTEFLKSQLADAGAEIALNGSSSVTDPRGSDSREADPPPTVQGRIDPLETTFPANTRGRSSAQAAGLIRISENPIAWARPPGFRSSRDPLLNFRLREVPPLLVHPENQPTLGVEVFLHFKADEGLSLIWYPLLQEDVDNERELFRTQVSPYVTKLSYIYWDERFERWEEDTEPREDDRNAYITPRYLKLEFEHNGVTAKRTVMIPVASRTAIIF